MSISRSNRRIAINTLILYGRLLITTITGLVCTRLLLKALGAEDLGLFYVVAGFISSINFLNAVLISASFRFIAVELGKGGKGNVNKVFNISFIIHVLLALIFLIVALTFGSYYIFNHLNVPESKVIEAFWVFLFSIIGTVFTILGIPYNGLITAHENFPARATIEIIRASARLLVVILVYQFAKNGLMVYALLMVFVTMLPPVLYFAYCRYKFPTDVKWAYVKDRNEYKSMLSFSGWLTIGTAASLGRVQIASLIINAFFGTILNAAFGIANQVNHLVTVFAQTLSQATIPQITKNYASNNKRSVKLVATISRMSFFMILIIALPILLNTSEILSLWLTEIPVYTSVFVQLMIINALLESLHSGLPAYINASGNIKWFKILNGLLLLLSLPVAYFLFRAGSEPYYITISYMGAYIVSRFTTFYQLKTILGFNVISYIKQVYVPSIYVILFAFPSYILNKRLEPGPVSLLITSLTTIILVIMGIYIAGISKEERKSINNATIGIVRKGSI